MTTLFFQQLFNVNWIEHDHIEIKPKKPESVSDAELDYLSEIMENTKTITNLSLDLRSCQAITIKGFSKIRDALSQIETFKKLRLNFSDCPNLSEVNLQSMIESLTKHTGIEDFSLILEGCPNIKATGLQSVLQTLNLFQNLQSLEFTPSTISDSLIEELRQALSPLEKITNLNLRFGSKDKKEGTLSDKGFQSITKILENLPGLENLCLEVFRGEWNVKDEGIISLASALYKLKGLTSLRLNLRGIDLLSEGGVGHLCEALTKLKKLRKLYLNFKTNNEENIFELRTPLSLLIELRSLYLDFSWGVSDAALSELKEAFFNLANLNQLSINLSGCENITDEGINDIGDILVNLPQLDDLKLELPWCHGFTDEGLYVLADAIARIPTLSHLSLNLERGNKGEDKITRQSLAEIIQVIGDKVDLKVLNLNFANRTTLTNEDMDFLGHALSGMEKLTNFTLDLKLCDEISDEGLDKIRAGLEELPSLNNVFLNFLWCGKMSEKGVAKLLELKKKKKMARFLIAFKKNEMPAEEGAGCQIF